MKKFYLGALGCLLTMGASAQTFEPVGTVPTTESYEVFFSIPSLFAANGESTPFTISETEGGDLEFYVYNKSFAVERTIKLGAPTSYNRLEIEAREKDVNGSYTGEWVRTTEYYMEEFNFLDVRMYPMVIGNGGELDNKTYIYATQTLFNDDAKWEFIRPVYEEKADEGSWQTEERDRDGDGEIDYKSVYYENQTVSYQIVSEDGNVLSTVDVAENDKCNPVLILWNNEVFFGLNRVKRVDLDYGANYLDIYSINKNSTAIKKVASTPGMRVSPSIANRNSIVNVILGGDTLKNGGELIITDSKGRTIGRRHVEVGQTSVPVTTDRMDSGVYNITLTEKGKLVENSRVVVK